MPRALSIPALVAAIVALGGRAGAQIPDTFENLKVLPKDIDKAHLVSLMRDVAGALGVRCNACHVGPEDLVEMDFASDEKRAKRVAREMFRMVNAINHDHLASIDTGRSSKVEVD
jgi:Photosynthetic reaction centre cytochrome C subunit